MSVIGKSNLIALTIALFSGCGEYRLKEIIDPEIKEMIEQNQIKKDPCYGTCTNVVISDRFAITAAHCLENYEEK